VRTVQGPRIWYKTVREIVTLERMHRAFADGLMEYGMARAVKAPSAGPAAAPAAAEEQQAAA
jgi:MPBQ/MSBQ methyltransferase